MTDQSPNRLKAVVVNNGKSAAAEGDDRALVRRSPGSDVAPQGPERGRANRPDRSGKADKQALLRKERRQELLRRANVEPLTLPPRERAAETGYTFRKFLGHSFLACVVLPTLLVGAFYLFVAADQFASSGRLTVRGAPGSSSVSDVGGLMGSLGVPTSNESSDSYILVDYIQSREVVEKLIKQADFLVAYTRPEADFWYRVDPNAPIEDLVDYWQNMISVEYEPQTGITSFMVRAFRPKDAERLAAAVLRLSEKLINEISLRAREDALRMARREVELAEKRFKESRAETARYRELQKEIDPVATATSQSTILGELESQLATRQAEMHALLATMSPQSPRVVYVRTQIDALKQQIKRQRTDLARASHQIEDDDALTRRLSRYEELVAEQQFADEAFKSALASLEAARVEADKQQRYVEVFVRAGVPEDSLYPEGLRWTAIVGIGALLLWGLMAMSTAAVRDHLG